MNMPYHIRQQAVQESFPESYDFPGKQQKLDSSVFTKLQKHFKITKTSQCGQVVKPTGLCPASTYNCPIRGSVPFGVRFTYLFIL